MALDTAILRAACNTTTGNQDFTTTDFGGGTPTAAILVCSGGITDGASTSGIHFGTAIIGGGGQASAAYGVEDNVANANCAKVTEATAFELTNYTTTRFAVGTISFITNGVRINWTTAPGSAIQMMVILLGGADLTSDVDSWGSIVGGGTRVVTTGFQPHLIFAQVSRTTSILTNAEWGCGAYDWDGGTSPLQRGMGVTCDDGSGTNESSTEVTAGEIVAIPGYNYQGARWAWDVSAISSTSYTIRNIPTSTAAGGASLALNVGTKGYKVVAATSPTATGDWSVTGLGFKPQLVVGILSLNTSIGIDNSTAAAGSHGICAFTPDAEFCESVEDEDAVTTMRARSISDNTAINLVFGGGTQAHLASFVSMDSDGFTLNFTTANGTAREWTFFAIEEDAAAPTGDTSNLVQDTMSVSVFAPSDVLTQNASTTLAQGVATATGFAPSITTTDPHDTTLAQGSSVVAGFAPTVTLLDASVSSLVQGAATSEGFAPSVATTEHILSDLQLGAVTVSGFAPTDITTEHILSSLSLGAASATGFASTAILTEGDQSTLTQGVATTTGFSPTVVQEQHSFVGVPLGAASATGFAPTSVTSEADATTLAQGVATATGFAPAVATTGFITSILEQGVSTVTGFAPEVVRVEGEWSGLELGIVVPAGFATTAVTTEHHRSSLQPGGSTITGNLPTVTLTQAKRSTLVQDNIIATGFFPLSFLTEGDRAGLPLVTASVVAAAPTVTVTEAHLSALEQGLFSVTGLAPTIDATGVVAKRRRRAGAGHGSKSKRTGYYRKILVDGVVHVVRSPEEELALWKAHLEKTRREKPGLAGEVEARSISRKVEIVENSLRAAEVQARYDPRKKEALLAQYSHARRELVRTKLRELLTILE